MSVRGEGLAMPLLILNMGCEMIYVLEQRLRAQEISVQRARRVLLDIVNVMLSPSFVDELFIPQEICSFGEAKGVCEKLAHCSIMKLNYTSMQKLYDLVSMGFKHQMVSVAEPRQILQVTLNHLGTVQALLGLQGGGGPVDFGGLSKRLLDTYGPFSQGQWWGLKRALDGFFQDRRTKISPLLHEGMQYSDGGMVIAIEGALPKGTDPPGTLRHFARPRSSVSSATASRGPLPIATATSQALQLANPSLYVAVEDVPCKLGANRYADGAASVDLHSTSQPPEPVAEPDNLGEAGSSASHPTKTLAVLQSLIASSASSSSSSSLDGEGSFGLSFLDSSSTDLSSAGDADRQVFDARERSLQHLAKSFGFEEKEPERPQAATEGKKEDTPAAEGKTSSEEGDDLLSLMDAL
jgi:Organic solute transport protein 1